MLTRRHFLQLASQSGAATLAGCGRTIGSSPPADALPGRTPGLADLALGAAKAAGATYSDLRFTDHAAHRWYLNDRRVENDEGLETTGRSSGFAIRTLVNGAWGFASDSVPAEAAVRAAVGRAIDAATANARRPDHVDLRLTPARPAASSRGLVQFHDPAALSRDEKIAALVSINDRLLATRGVVHANIRVTFDRERRSLVTSEGARIDEESSLVRARLVVHARTGRRSRTRSHVVAARSGGFEAFDRRALLEQCERVAGEAVTKCSAGFFDGVCDLIVSPSHMLMPLHLWVALPTEADRMNGPGTGRAPSFLCVPDIGTFRYGAPLLNVNGGAGLDPQYDDDGVERQSFPLIREGRLVGAQTTRDTAASLGLPASTGCARAVNWNRPPLVRTSALSVELPPHADTVEALIADTRSGVLLDGAGTWLMSADGRTAEWGADAAWEITNGRLTRMLEDVRYRTSVTELFQSLDALAGPAQAAATPLEAKGSPAQLLVRDHRLPWLRFKNIRLASASRGGA